MLKAQFGRIVGFTREWLTCWTGVLISRMDNTSLLTTYGFGGRTTDGAQMNRTAAVSSFCGAARTAHDITSAVRVNGTSVDLASASLSIRCVKPSSVVMERLADDKYTIETVDEWCTNETNTRPAPFAKRQHERRDGLQPRAHVHMPTSVTTSNNHFVFTVEDKATYTIEIYDGVLGPTRSDDRRSRNKSDDHHGSTGDGCVNQQQMCCHQ